MLGSLVEEWLLLMDDPSFAVRPRHGPTSQPTTTAPAERFVGNTDQLDYVDFSLSAQIMVQVADRVGRAIGSGLDGGKGERPMFRLTLEVDPMELLSASPTLGALLLRPQAPARTVLSSLDCADSTIILLPSSVTSLDALCSSANEAAHRWLEAQTHQLRSHYSGTGNSGGHVPQDPVSQYMLCQGYQEPWEPVLVRPSYAPTTPSAMFGTPYLSDTNSAARELHAGGWIERNFIVSEVEFVAPLQQSQLSSPLSSSALSTILPTGRCVLRDQSTRRSYRGDLFSIGAFAVSVRRQDAAPRNNNDDVENVESSILEVASCIIPSQLMQKCLVIGSVIRCLCLEVSTEGMPPSSTVADVEGDHSRDVVALMTTQPGVLLAVFAASSRPGDNLSSNEAIEQVLAHSSHHPPLPTPNHPIITSVSGPPIPPTTVSTFDCWVHWRECSQAKLTSHVSIGAHPQPPTMDDHFAAVRDQWTRFASGVVLSSTVTSKITSTVTSPTANFYDNPSVVVSPTSMGTMVGVLLTILSSRLQIKGGTPSSPSSPVGDIDTVFSSTCRPLSAAVVGRSLPLEQLLHCVLDGVVDAVEGPTGGSAVPTASVSVPTSRGGGGGGGARISPAMGVGSATFSVQGGSLSQGPMAIVHPLTEHLANLPLHLSAHFIHSLSRGTSGVARMDVGNLLAPIIKRASASQHQQQGSSATSSGGDPQRGRGRGGGVGAWVRKQQPHTAGTNAPHALPNELLFLTQFLRSKGLITPAGNSTPTSDASRDLSVPFMRTHSSVYLCAIDQHISARPPSLHNIISANKSTGAPKDVCGLLTHCDLLLPLSEVLTRNTTNINGNMTTTDHTHQRRRPSLEDYMEGTSGVDSPKEFSPDAYAILQSYYRCVRRESAMGNDSMALLVRLATAHAMLKREKTVTAQHQISGDTSIRIRLLHDTVDVVDVIVAIAIFDLQCQIRCGCSVLTFPFFSEALKPEFSCVEFHRDLSVYLQHCSESSNTG